MTDANDTIDLTADVPALQPIDPAAPVAYQAAFEAVQQAEADLVRAQVRASFAAQAIANPKASHDPRQLLKDRKEAEDQVQELEALLPVLRLQLGETAAGWRRAAGETHRDRLEHGRRLRLQASLDHQAALDAAERAIATHAFATSLIRAAYSAGIPQPGEHAYLDQLRTPKAEKALWEGVA